MFFGLAGVVALRSSCWHGRDLTCAELASLFLDAIGRNRRALCAAFSFISFG